MSPTAVPGRGLSGRAGRDRVPRRVAMLTVHTSPLEQPGTGDAGGMNVYIVETARRLAARGTEVEIFTRATSSGAEPVTELAPGVLVRHVTAGPFEGLSKDDLPGQLCAFTAGVMRVEARREPGWYDLVHSHYWLSGQVGWLAADRWCTPLVHTMHTMAKVKNAMLADGDRPEPAVRVIGEEQVVDAADGLVANTDDEARQLVELYGARPERVSVVPPGVDLDVFTPGGPDGRAAARRRLGVPQDADLLLFVGRIQPLKAPDVLVRAAAHLVRERAARGVARPLQVAIVGGPSGSGLDRPEELQRLVADLGLGDVVTFHPPAPRALLAHWYRAADVVTVPSYNESFGLVAVEAQACGSPVVAAAVGGLPTAVSDGVSGLLVDGHDPLDWARVLGGLLADRPRRDAMAAAAVLHASRFSWEATVDRTLEAYAEAVDRHRNLLRAPLGAGSGPLLVPAGPAMAGLGGGLAVAP
nr:D-inositol-3-phosphate glycosyltransferase [Kineosporia sp. A_224]